ncbi:pRL2-8 [Streptomyces sp. NPDC088730]|uniref:pRL2-8 n=1 Tax=Streptomyces sp. NPDC088730 TaxID=3365877 RepID=UPI00381BABB2
MAKKKATSPPRGECSQCWFHVYASREAHAALGPREDCPQCVAHMKHGHPDHMIVR